jgi:hypothetical protein
MVWAVLLLAEGTGGFMAYLSVNVINVLIGSMNLPWLIIKYTIFPIKFKKSAKKYC